MNNEPAGTIGAYGNALPGSGIDLYVSSGLFRSPDAAQSLPLFYRFCGRQRLFYFLFVCRAQITTVSRLQN
ncbi:hypothetical protein HA39_10075 [Pantoea brenneri]|nr:hypothetical protein HA39_10075 [Pantoea brenneri]